MWKSDSRPPSFRPVVTPGGARSTAYQGQGGRVHRDQLVSRESKEAKMHEVNAQKKRR
jgi:hypothetical protein